MTETVVGDQHIETKAGRIFVRTWTPAPESSLGHAPILLFHDSLGCVDLWRNFPESLARVTGRAVIAYDRLGFGRSDPFPGVPGSDFVAGEAAMNVPLLKDRFGFTRFIACGHSVGGGMAVETAARFPDDCAALVTMGAQAFVEQLTLDGIRRAREEYARPEGLSRLEKYHGDKARRVVDAWTETWLAPGFAGWSLDGALSRVRCPVLAIHGEQDEYGSTEHPQRIARGRGMAEILPGVGHVPYREREEDVVMLISRFLSGI